MFKVNKRNDVFRHYWSEQWPFFVPLFVKNSRPDAMGTVSKVPICSEFQAVVPSLLLRKECDSKDDRQPNMLQGKDATAGVIGLERC